MEQSSTERPRLQFESASITYIGEVPPGDVVELVEDLSHDCYAVKTTRLNFGIAAGGPGFLEAAVVISIVAGSTVALSFLQELGKDAYHGLRATFQRVYRQRGNLDTGRGRYLPLEISATEQGVPLMFIFDEGLSAEEFEHALKLLGETAKSAIAEVGAFDSSEVAPCVQLKYDPATQSWKREFAMDLRSHRPISS